VIRLSVNVQKTAKISLACDPPSLPFPFLKNTNTGCVKDLRTNFEPTTYL